MQKRRPSFEWGEAGWHEPLGGRVKPYAALVPIVAGKYRAARTDRISRAAAPVIEAKVESKNGWHRGYGIINGVRLYQGKATRDRDQAWDYANRSMRDIKEGLAHG